MIGAIIEKVSGERFDQYVKTHVLDPLKLYGGYYVDALDRSRFASLYEYRTDSAKFILSTAAYLQRAEAIAAYTIGYSTPVFSPTGGMKISARDLASYMIMHSKMGKHQGVRIISEESARQMQTALSEEEGYGFAIETTSKLIPGKIMKGHTGSAYGLYSAMFFHPKEKFGIVVISNGCDPSYTEGFNTVLRKTVNCLYENLIKE
jgi:CubicO group peptidase (beta-lactamase class C family)